MIPGAYTLIAKASSNTEDGCGRNGGGFASTSYTVELTAEAFCTTDLDDSGAVDFGDILVILAQWGPCEGCPEDLDGSGAVDFGDILVVLGAWGPCE